MKKMGLPFDVSLNLFKEVFENVPDIAVNLLNKDFTVLWANNTMAMAVDQSLADMIGKPRYKVWRRRDTLPSKPICAISSQKPEPQTGYGRQSGPLRNTGTLIL